MKKVYKILLSIIALFVLLFFLADYFLESKIENEIKKSVPQNVDVDYKNLDLNILTGTITVTEFSLKQLDSLTKKHVLDIDLGDFEVIDFSYVDYFLHKKINIDEILFKESTIVYFPDNDKYQPKHSDTTQHKPLPEIDISNFKIENSNLIVYKNRKDSLSFKMNNFNFSLKDIVFNESIKNNKTPFKYGDYSLKLDSLFAKASTYEDVKLGQVLLNKERLFVKDLKFYNIYSRSHFDKLIPHEKDHFTLTVDDIELLNPIIEDKNDSVSVFTSPKLKITNSTLTVYRNKLIADDLSYKPLYSKMLRDLKFNLGIDTIALENANVNYFEKAKLEEEPGEIIISKIDATIKQLGNIYPHDKATSINVNGLFMKHAPLKLDWSFKTFNTLDHFKIKGEIDNLNTTDLNQFMKHNLHIELKGQLDKTIFYIDGNDTKSNVDLKVKFENFEVIALKKHSFLKNKFLSGVINTFLFKNSKSKHSDFKEGQKKGVKRDKTKSIFNFIFLNIKDGLAKAMT